MSPLLELVKFCVGRDFHAVPDTQKMLSKYFLNEWMNIKHSYTVHILFLYLTNWDHIICAISLLFVFPQRGILDIVHVSISGGRAIF